MKCPKCGNEVLSTDINCKSCGVHLATAFAQQKVNTASMQKATGKVCPKCGHAVNPTDLTCSNCAHYLGPYPTSPTSYPNADEDTFYKIFLYSPIIFAVITAIMGIFLALEFDDGLYFLIGIFSAAIIGVCTRIVMSPIIAVINYLKAIERNTRKK